MHSQCRLFLLTGVMTLAAAVAHAAVGDPLPNLKPQETKFFSNGKLQFQRVWGLREGVGPVFVDGSCERCHNVPTIGGGSTRHWTFLGKLDQDGTFDPLDGTGPSGENEGGIMLQPRSTQSFLPACSQGGEKIPPDANVVEDRTTPQTFGYGLIDAIADAALLNQAAFELNNYQADGIHGISPNVSTLYAAAPNTIGRFGQKSEFANLVEMTAFAFANALGITNPLFPNENLPQGIPIDPNCTENTQVPNNGNTGSGGGGIFPLSHFMRFLAPVPAGPCPGSDCVQGQVVFNTIGCNECHLPTYTTPANVRIPIDLSGTSALSKALSNQTVNLYSDLLLHDLGDADKGGIPQNQIVTGVATITQWRTAPLWGLQYRHHYMHNGAAKTLDAAIRGHSDGVSGEAVTVINRYKALSASDQQALWDFLNTL